LTNDFTSSGSGSSTDGAGANSAAQAHNKAADEAVANLQSIANAYMSKEEEDNKERKARAEKETKEREENESKSGYNTDDEGARGFNRGSLKHTRNPEDVASCVTNNNSADGTNNDNTCDETSSITPSQASTNADTNERPTKKKKLHEKKREERNAREKERSFRISKQINELRNLLSTGGVIVPKGTKSSVLTEAANYIRMLQQHQYRSEL
jgi:hypothetical protein